MEAHVGSFRQDTMMGASPAVMCWSRFGKNAGFIYRLGFEA
jgi:hypothetical protein